MMDLLLRQRWLASALGGTLALAVGLTVCEFPANLLKVSASEYEILEIVPEDLPTDALVAEVDIPEWDNNLEGIEEVRSDEPTQPIGIGRGVLDNALLTEEERIKATGSNVPNWLSDCKSYNLTYMSYTAVTSKRSKQYKLLNSDRCFTDETTGIRMIDGRYCIALGSYYTHDVGRYVDIVFADGTIVQCVVGDCKSDADTDDSNRFQKFDGSVAEFVVDYESFNSVNQWDGLFGGEIYKVVILDDSVCWEDI